MERIYGAGGIGKGGGIGSEQSARTPTVADDSLDSKQYATVIDLISEGEIQGLKDGSKSIFLNNTPLQNPDDTYNFNDVTVRTRNGTQDQSYIQLAPDVEDEKPVNVEVQYGTPVTRQITDTNVNAVRITLTVPQLQRSMKNGDVLGHRVNLKIEVQYDGGGFTQVGDEKRIKGRTTDPYQRDYLVNLTAGFTTVDIRVTRVSVADATYVSNNEDVAQAISRFNWTSYTEIIDAKLRYPNSALVALRVDAEQFSAIPSRSYLIRGIKVQIPSNATVDNTTGRLIYSGIWNGTFGAAQWCSDPAWILWDLLTSTRYGFGDHIQAAQLDKFAFYSASQYCSELVPDGFGSLEPRFSCNVNIQTAEDAYKLINDMCSVMRVMPYWSTGTLTISQDKPADTAYLFTLANVTEEGFSYQGASRKTRPNVCVVSYLDLETRDIAYEVVEDADGIDKYGVVKTEISAFACTSRGQAYRIGEWLLYSERYESEIISFTTSIDAGVVVRPGQIIEVADPVRAGARRGGRIASATTTAITVDDATGLTAVDAELSVIMPDGTVETRTIASITSPVITVSSAFSVAPNANSVWIYQTSSIQTSTWRVLTVNEQDGLQYAISAIAYNASKYNYIESGTALEQRDITDLNIIPSTPTNLVANEVFYDSGGIAKTKLLVSWQPVLGVSTYRIEWRDEDGNWNIETLNRPDYEILDTSAANYEILVYSIAPNLRASNEPAQLTKEAAGKTALPITPTGISLIPNSETTAILSWDRATELDVLLGGKVVIRHSTLLSGATWQNSQDIVSAAAGSQTQKQVPLLEGTYLIKFEDDGGRRSVSPATSAVELPTPQPRLLVESYREDQETPPFDGTLTNMTYDSGQGGLILTDVSSNGEYEFDATLDLGGVFDLNMRRYLVTGAFSPYALWDDFTDLIDTWPDIDGGELDKVNAALYVRSTPDDPSGSPTWSDWNEFANAINRGRGFQFKVVAASTSSNENIIIFELGADLELQQRTESTGSLTSGAGSYAVTFDEPFYEAPAIAITAYNMATGDYYTVASQTRTGFTITFYNSSNSVISRDFTYIATGYGREIV